MSQYCWTSLLATDDYVWGILGLYYSLQKVRTQYPFIPIVTDNISLKTLKLLDQAGIEYRIFPYREFQTSDVQDPEDEYYHYYNCTINKFYIYSYTDFEKIIFLDGDVIVNTNIDFFFHFPAGCCAKYPGESISSNIRIGGIYGYLWSVEPNVDRMNYIFKEYINESNDESILNSLYFWECKKNFNWFPEDIALFYHDTNKPKYWELYHLDTLERVQYFINYNAYYYIIHELNYHHPVVQFDIGGDYEDTTLAKIQQGEL